MSSALVVVGELYTSGRSGAILDSFEGLLLFEFFFGVVVGFLRCTGLSHSQGNLASAHREHRGRLSSHFNFRVLHVEQPSLERGA